MTCSKRVVLIIALLCLAGFGWPGLAATKKTAALRAAGSAGWLAGPVTGFLIDQTALQIRAVLGIPGAAIAGEPLALPEGVSRIRVAPRHRYAILELGDTSLPAILDLEAGGVPVSVAGGMPRADVAAFSPEGRSAALYSRSRQRVQVLTQLPRDPRMVRELDLPDAEAIAVSDDGEWLLAATSDGVVNLIAADGGAAPVFRTSEAPLLAFLPGRAEALVGDTGRGEIQLLAGLDGNFSSRLVAAGLTGVTGIAASADGAAIIAVAAETALGWRVDLESGAVRAFDLPARPELLETLRLPDSFLISSRAGEPAWLFIAREFETRAYFVPAVTSGETEAEQ